MVKIKTFDAASSAKLDQKVNKFLADPAVEVIRLHFSSGPWNAWVLIEYESRTG